MHRERDEERGLTVRGGGPAAFSRRRRKGIKGRQKAAFNGRGPTIPWTRKLRSLRMHVDLPCIGIAFRRAGIIRLHRSGLLLLLLRPVTAHCCRRIVRKQHFRRSRWRQEEDLNSSPSQQSAPRGVGGHRPMHLTRGLRVRASLDSVLSLFPPPLFVQFAAGMMMIILERPRQPRKHLNLALLTRGVYYTQISNIIKQRTIFKTVLRPSLQ